MGNADKPSILNDRRAIGSEKELDEYGVWLKSESEEFAASEQDGSGEDYFPPFEEKRIEEKRGPAVGAYGEHASAAVSSEKTAMSGTPVSDVTLSAALLLKIAEELALIKTELAALKAELDRRQDGRETPAVVEAAKDVAAETGFDDAAGMDITEEKTGAETAAEYAAVAKESVAEEPATDAESLSPEKDAVDTGTDFFGTDKSDDKITLTSSELDLLGEDAGESVEEMDDSFFADDRDEEKIAVSGDEISDILGGLEIPAEAASNEGAKVEEITLADIPDEPVTESGPAEAVSAEIAPEPETETSVSGEDRTAGGNISDTNIEPEEESASDSPANAEPETETGLAEDTFDIDHIEIEEEHAETPSSPDNTATDLNTEPEEDPFLDDLSALEPETETSLAEDAFDIDHIEIEEEHAEASPRPDNTATDLNVEPEEDPFLDDLSALEPETETSLAEDAFDIDHIEIEEEHAETSPGPDNTATDLNVEPEKESSFDDLSALDSETEINFAEDAFDIDDISLNTEEVTPETPVEPDDSATDLDKSAETSSSPDNAVTDLNIEPEEESSFDDLSNVDPETEINFAEDTFDIDDISLNTEDTPETPVEPDDSATDLDKSAETSSISDNAVTDLNIEPEEESSFDDLSNVDPETEINFAEDTFDIDDISLNTEVTPETPVELDDSAADLDTGAEEDEPTVAEPETADIAFDPFGSLPDEDALNKPDTDTAETADEDAPFADFSVLEDSSSAGIEDAVMDDLTDTGAVTDTTSATDTTNTTEEDSPVSGIAGADADPVLSRLMDEDFHQTAPAPEDTAYLDDEKPLEFDESAEPEAPASSETSGPSPDGKPDTPQNIPVEDDLALQGVPLKFKEELRTVLSYMDILLESLPDEKIEEFARSEHFEPYKKLFKELGLA